MESISFYISQYYLSIISFQKKKKKEKLEDKHLKRSLFTRKR